VTQDPRPPSVPSGPTGSRAGERLTDTSAESRAEAAGGPFASASGAAPTPSAGAPSEADGGSRSHGLPVLLNQVREQGHEYARRIGALKGMP